MNYHEDRNFRFKCQISTRGYDHKPVWLEVANIQNDIREAWVSLDDFLSLMGRGFAYRAGERRKEEFSQFQIISFDIDGCPMTMNDYIDCLIDKPTIAYTSPSNGIAEKKKSNEDGIYRFRLIYVASKSFYGTERYDAFRDEIEERNAMRYVDAKSKPAVHYFNGNAKPNIEKYVSARIYDFSDIQPKNSEENSGAYKEGRSITHRSLNSPDDLIALGVTLEFANDCMKMSFRDFLDKWLCNPKIHPTIVKMKYSSDYIEGIHPYAVVAPEDYMAVLRYKVWDHEKNHTVERKWRDGENRHGKIFYSAKVIKELNPWLTLEQFIYWTVNEYVVSYENFNIDGTHKYTLASFIDSIVIPAWNANSEIKFTPKHAKIHVKDEAVEKTGKTKKQLAPTIAADLRRKSIMKDYDYSISVDENLKKYRERGVRISRRTLLRYLKKQRAEEAIVPLAEYKQVQIV